MSIKLTRRQSLAIAGSVVAAQGLIQTLSTARAQSSTLRIFSYASQVNDVDAVNSHWFETSDGVVLVDTQRLLPEAERALEHLRASTEQDVSAIIITHAHTDHYGGLPVFVEAFPNAAIYIDETTLGSVREDRRGYIAARVERHGDRFATQERLTNAVKDAVVVADGETITIGNVPLQFEVFAASEAESTLAVVLPGQNVVFIGDLINFGVPAVPFESLATWLEQLDEIEAAFGTAQLYQGHGISPVGMDDLADQRRFLVRLRDLVTERVEDGVLSADERSAIVFDLESEWPFYAGVGGNTRQKTLAFDADTVAEQMGATVEGSKT